MQPRNRTILSAPAAMLSVVCVLSVTAGCSAIGTRIVDGGYFTGVRGDYDMMFRRETIDPKSRVQPALAAADMPFSCVADILFLPYDAFSGSATPRDSACGPIVKFADDIRRNIPAGWSVTVSNTTVRVRSKRDMTLIGRIARPAMPGGMEQLAREMGDTGKYEVILAFVPRLSDSELEQLRAARQPFERTLNGGARSRVDYAKAQTGYAEHPVPVYYPDAYSIFVDRPIDRFVEIYPPDAAKQVEQLMAALDRLFHEY